MIAVAGPPVTQARIKGGINARINPTLGIYPINQARIPQSKAYSTPKIHNKSASPSPTRKLIRVITET